MSHTRIHKYIIKENCVPALLSLVIFTFILLMGRLPRLMELVVNKGVPLGDILTLFLYLLPTFFIITFPLAFLLGILLAFGRLSSDSEFIALKSTGVSLYTMIAPVFLLGILFSALTGLITTIVEPASQTAFRAKVFEVVSSSASFDIKPDVFYDDLPGITLYTKSVDDQTNIMNSVFLADERDENAPALITAAKGTLLVDQASQKLVLRLQNGSIHRTPPGDNLYQTIRFANYDINIDIESQLTGTKTLSKKDIELSWHEIQTILHQNPAKKDRLKLEALFYQRIVIAFAPLVLVLVGAPLGLQSQRSGKGAGFAMALVVFLVYYILLSIAGALAQKGLIHASIIYWLPNLLFFFGGIYFVYCTANEKPLAFLSWLTTLKEKLSRKRLRS